MRLRSFMMAKVCTIFNYIYFIKLKNSSNPLFYTENYFEIYQYDLVFTMKFLSSFFRKIGYRINSPPDQEEADERIIERLRSKGVQIGKGCRIYTTEFSTEPFLVTIGDNVAISGSAKILTHNGAARLLKARRPMIQSFGKVDIESDCFIGENVIILPGTRIGRGSIIGAGAVVRGRIPENSLVVGNPAQIVGSASLFLERLDKSSDTLDTFGLDEQTRRAIILAHFS